MKRVLTITIFLFTIAIVSYSQLIYRPMLEEGKTWVYSYHHFDEEETNDGTRYNEEIFDVTFSFQGDTIIGGLKYKRLIRCCNQEINYYAALREEGMTLFCIYAETTNEFIIMEFNPTKFENAGYYGIFIDYKDTITVNEREFTRHVYESTDEDYRLVGVEGVGFDGCGLVLGMTNILPTCVCDYMDFKACYENGECIFTQEHFHTTSDVNATHAKERNPSQFFDLQGRRLQNKPGKGVYVSKGRKMVR